MIERNLDPGSYQVIVKGDAATDEGAYKLSLRDVDAQPVQPPGLRQRQRRGHEHYIEQSLTAGTYYVVLKGNEPTSKGAYTLSVRDVTNRPLSSTFCDDNGSTQSSVAAATASHAVSHHLEDRPDAEPGHYYVALKGKDANAKGPYQLSVGAGATHARLLRAADLVARRWPRCRAPART